MKTYIIPPKTRYVIAYYNGHDFDHEVRARGRPRLINADGTYGGKAREKGEDGKTTWEPRFVDIEIDPSSPRRRTQSLFYPVAPAPNWIRSLYIDPVRDVPKFEAPARPVEPEAPKPEPDSAAVVLLKRLLEDRQGVRAAAESQAKVQEARADDYRALADKADAEVSYQNTVIAAADAEIAQTRSQILAIGGKLDDAPTPAATPTEGEPVDLMEPREPSFLSRLDR